MLDNQDSRYVGDGDGDGQAELYLSTLDHMIDDDHVIHPTTYRVLRYEPPNGFVEVRRISTDELPLDRLMPLRDDEYTTAEILEAIPVPK